jgi:hypothetical protein
MHYIDTAKIAETALLAVKAHKLISRMALAVALATHDELHQIELSNSYTSDCSRIYAGRAKRLALVP